MDRRSTNAVVLLLHASLLLLSSWHGMADAGGVEADDSILKSYIIHVRPTGAEFPPPEHRESWYASLLSKVVTSSPSKERILFSYSHVANGFAARLTEEEVEAMSGEQWFLHADPDSTVTAQTTHSPEFLGLQQSSGVWKQSNYGEGVIIGILDTGLEPGHPSFSGEGMPPPPAKWKGHCNFPPSLCNNKVIGARAFKQGENFTSPPYEKPNLDYGHGTHTSSIAAGAFVKNASILGFAARGTAVGVAPRAHIAFYSIGDQEMMSNDGSGGFVIPDFPDPPKINATLLLMAFDTAVADGVDVVSLSFGSPAHGDYLDEDVFINAAFRAVVKGIFVSVAGGNAGPAPSTVEHEAPWVLTAGASSMDRTIAGTTKLGNGVVIEGESLAYLNNSLFSMLPLVVCSPNLELKDDDVRGKILVIDVDNGEYPTVADGVILVYAENKTVGLRDRVRETSYLYVSYSDGNKIRAYANSTSNPTANMILTGTVVGAARAPVIPSFSPRGPNRASPGILKPDIVGPGVDVLAAYPHPMGSDPYSYPIGSDDHEVLFSFRTGTSHSCPHLSGVAALIKSLHPTWSPAAIKSAIMTTAYVLDNRGDPIRDERGLPASLFALGAGHVNVTRATDPGLIYNITTDDYISYLCGGLRYEDRRVQSLTQNYSLKCSDVKGITETELNYPSITVPLGPGATSFTVSRTVTNVGEASSTYLSEIEVPEGVSVTVKPGKLQFTRVDEQQKFWLVFTTTGKGQSASGYGEGQLKWVSKNHVVRSPISIKFAN